MHPKQSMHANTNIYKREKREERKHHLEYILKSKP